MSVPKVYEAINAITAVMAKEGIAKGRKNQQQGYMFRGIDEVYGALSGALSEHKLCILPRVLTRTVTERQTKNGGTLFYTALEVEYDFVSVEDGSKHTVRVVGEAMDSADKSSNKAMSAAYKYACLQTFCIPTEGDNDADATTHDVAPRNQPQQRQQPRSSPGVSVSDNDVKALRAVLNEAAKNGTMAFRKAWSQNAGAVRAAIAANKTTMEHLQSVSAKADAEASQAKQPAQLEAS